MNKLLKSNIRRSFKIIAENNPKIPSELITVVNDPPGTSRSFSLIEEMMKVAAQPVPWFYIDQSNELKSPQETFFGFYALRNIIRGLLLSVRFIQAGDLLSKNDFLASSVFSYYTASYHLLQSFLALHGRVVIDQVRRGPIRVIKGEGFSEGGYSSEAEPKVIVATLTKKNTWKFEPRPRSHSSRWKELELVCIELKYDIPDFIESFFHYVLTYGPYSPPEEIEKLVKDGLKRLSDIRHESIYAGYGFDDYVHDGLTNRDLDTSYGIDRKSTAYRDFAFGFLLHALNAAFEIKDHIDSKHWEKEKILMLGSVNTPPFELVDLTIVSDQKITERLQTLFTSLMSRDKGRPR